MIELYSKNAHETLKENLCLSCSDQIRGNCCHFSVCVGEEKRFNILLEKHSCKYLDSETRWCIIYKDRLKKNPNVCHSIEYAIKNKSLVKNCLYVKNNEEYQAIKDTIIYIDDIRDQLTERELLDYELTNASARRFITRY